MNPEQSLQTENEIALTSEIELLKISILKEHLYANREIINKLSRGFIVSLPSVKIIEQKAQPDQINVLDIEPNGDWADRYTNYGEDLDGALEVFALITEPVFKKLYDGVAEEMSSLSPLHTKNREEYERKVDELYATYEENKKLFIKENKEKLLTGLRDVLLEAHNRII